MATAPLPETPQQNPERKVIGWGDVADIQSRQMNSALESPAVREFLPTPDVIDNAVFEASAVSTTTSATQQDDGSPAVIPVQAEEDAGGMLPTGQDPILGTLQSMSVPERDTYLGSQIVRVAAIKASDVHFRGAVGSLDHILAFAESLTNDPQSNE